MRARRIGAVPVVDADGRPVGLHLLQQFLGPSSARTGRSSWPAAGRAAAPLTDNLPKPMLAVAGRPILERIVLHLVGSGIRRIFLSVNYLGDVIEEHFGDGRGSAPGSSTCARTSRSAPPGRSGCCRSRRPSRSS